MATANTMTATLQNLAEDVVLNILCYCGISGVLAVSQTCRQLNTLVFTKLVWLSLLRDVRLLLDGWPESSLRQFTTAELIDWAKRMVQGPQTWSRSHPSRPVIVRQEVIHPVMKLGFGAMFWENEPKLLSGGQYILFSNGRVLECWKVAENRLVWKHQSHWESPSVRQFAAEVVDDSQAAVIVICEGIEDDMWKIVMEVVRLDFLTETSRSLFAPDTKFINAFDWLRICGDIAIMGYNATNEIFIMNWKTQSSFVLLASSPAYDVALLSTDIIIIIESGPSPESCHMDVWSVQSLAEFWSPCSTHHHKMVPTSDVRPLLSTNIPLPSAHTARIIRLSAHISPLREDLVVIWACIYSACQESSSLKSTICKFSLNLTPAATPQLCLQSTTCVQGRLRVNRDISYAGYTETFNPSHRVHRIVALSEPGSIMNDDGHIIHLPDKGVPVHVSAYSGALTYATQSSVVVSYYQ